MPEKTVTLACVTEEDARIVAREADRPGDPDHTVRQDGNRVIITYFDKRFPLDVADWAFQNGHASDAETASTIARL
jgi:hypothetical protein